MINYLLGAIITIITIYIILKQIRKVKDGKCSCDNSCTQCDLKNNCDNSCSEKK